MTQKTVAIIGGGMAGLTTAQSYKLRGIEPVIFEKNSKLGGIWNNGEGKTWSGLETNISRYHMNFPNFPWKQNQNDFPKNSKVNDYLNQFSNHFMLDQHTYYNHAVTKCSFNAQDKKYHLKLNGKQDFATDFVANCNGIFNKPYLPTKFKKAQNLFRSKKKLPRIIHSAEYKGSKEFYGLKVLVVGSGMSGTEISADLARNDVEAVHLAHNNNWIIKRTVNNVPFDMLSYNYSSNASLLLNSEDRHNQRVNFIERTFGNPGDAHPVLYMDKKSPLPFSVAVSDDYCDLVSQKKITSYRNSIDQITADGVTLYSGEEIDADVIIACTGYTSDLTLYDQDILADLNYNQADRLQPFIADLATMNPAHPSMAFVANYRAPYMPTTYLQGEYAASIHSGEIAYQNSDEVQKSLQIERDLRDQSPPPQFAQNYMSLTLKLAERMGRLPHDLIEQAKTSIVSVPMCPADFLRYGPYADFEFADAQRKIHLQHLKTT